MDNENPSKVFGEAVAAYMLAGADFHKAWTQLKPFIRAESPEMLEAVAKMDEAAAKEQKQSVDLFIAVVKSASASGRAVVGDMLSKKPGAPDPYSGR